MVYKLTLKV